MPPKKHLKDFRRPGPKEGEGATDPVKNRLLNHKRPEESLYRRGRPTIGHLPRIQIHASISRPMEEQLRLLGARKGLGMSALVEEVLQEYFKTTPK